MAVGKRAAPVAAAALAVVVCSLLGRCGESAPDPCAGVSCSSRGFCVADQGSAYCVCLRGFRPQGLACVPIDSANPCEDVDCFGHGTCRQAGDDILCECEPGYRTLSENDPGCADPGCDLICVRAPPGDGPQPPDGRDDAGEDAAEGEGDRAAPEAADDAPPGDEGLDETGADEGGAECGDGTVDPGEECDGGSDACGRCGTRSCRDDCTWGPCEGEGECESGATGGCALCGTETCGEDCTWGPCEDQGDCEPEATEPCGTTCTGTVTCGPDCLWGPCECAAPGRPCTTADGCPGTEPCTAGVPECAWGACAGPSCWDEFRDRIVCPGTRAPVRCDVSDHCHFCTCSDAGAWDSCDSGCSTPCP
jgi:hypothetical protein